MIEERSRRYKGHLFSSNAQTLQLFAEEYVVPSKMLLAAMESVFCSIASASTSFPTITALEKKPKVVKNIGSGAAHFNYVSKVVHFNLRLIKYQNRRNHPQNRRRLDLHHPLHLD